MLSIFFFYGEWPILVLRLVLAAIFLAHGWPKVRDLKKNGANFDGMGFKPGMFWGTAAAFLEFVGGLGLLFGLFTHYFAALLVLEFIVILIWRLSKKMPFVGGWEFDLLILAALLIIVFLGSGAYSIDRMFLLGL